MDRLHYRISSYRRTSLLEMLYILLRATTRNFTIYLGAVLLFLIGASLLQSNELSLGEFTAFMLYYFRVMWGLTDLIKLITEQHVHLFQAEKLYQFKSQAPDVCEPESPITLPAVKGEITFENVNFSYRDGSSVLQDFNLKIRSGERIALIGKSGSGKSTVIKLIGRFYDPQSGDIFLDGINIRKLLFAQLRGALGFVFQETYLFGTTIRENIRFGNPQANEQQIIEAAKAAYAHEFIMEFPNGYDTLIGERGIKLSGGQKQRIAVARMLLKDPSIIILDEATSALDNISEREVQQALETLLKGRTTITVAHRLSTVQNYDIIAVLDEGKLVEMGRYEQLMKQHGYLYKMVEGDGENE
jgi:ATP-binding cassette subfamily B protein